MKPLDMGSFTPAVVLAYLGGSVTGVCNITSHRDLCGLIEAVGILRISWCLCGSVEQMW
jgi:hypothetical protein